MSWEDAWRAGRTGWDAGGSPPVLHDLVRSGVLPQGRALVPGCGAGYDVLTLASPDRSVTGVDLAPTAAKRFEALREERGIPPEQARIVTANFFELEHDEPFDLVFDYTFLCAIQPAERPAWAEQMRALLRPGGQLVQIVFPITDAPLDQGPPFALRPEHLEELLEPGWERLELREVERSHPGREGKEWLGRWRR